MPDPVSESFAQPQQSVPPLLAFMLGTHGHQAGAAATGAQVIAGDWFVLAHLAFFFLLLGCFGLAVWSIWRRTTRPEPHVRLLMELEGQAEGDRAGGPAFARGPTPETDARARVEREPWERAEDWWRQ